MNRVYKFIHQIDRTYRGLGLPVLYGVLSIMANKSVFFVTGRGKGKTRTIKLIPQVADEIIQNWDTFTLGGLAERVGVVANQHLIWKVEEFSTLSRYHREIFLTVCSKIISEGTYIHITKQMMIDIEDCKLTLLIAIQPQTYANLCRQYEQWDAMSYDRFTKFLLLNPLRVDTKDVALDPELPKHIVSINDVKLGEDANLTPVTAMYGGQVSAGRAYIYARDYVKALAAFLDEETVKPKHVKLFRKLFYPYLISFSKVQYRKDLDSSIIVSGGTMSLLTEIGTNLGGSRKDALAKKLLVTEREIEVVSNKLLERKMISKETYRSQPKKRTTYHLAPFLKRHFRWYNKVIKS